MSDTRERVAMAIAAALYETASPERLWEVLTDAEKNRLRTLADAAIIEYVAAVADLD